MPLRGAKRLAESRCAGRAHVAAERPITGFHGPLWALRETFEPFMLARLAW